MRIHTLFSVLVIVILVSCGAPRAVVHSDFVRGVDFDDYQSYAWLPGIDTSEHSVHNNEIVMQNIRRTVEQEMNRRGIVLDTANPDILIITHVMLEEQEERVREPLYNHYDYYYQGFRPRSWYHGYYSRFHTIPRVVGYEVRTVPYTQGTIIIDVIDNESKKVVWRGWSERRVMPRDFSGQAQQDVMQILDDLPVEEGN